MAEAKRKVTISVESVDEIKERTVSAARTGKFGGSHISFATRELLWKALPPKRLALLETLIGQAPMSIREAARRVGRDIKAVHGDVQLLLAKRILAKTEDGLIEFPYDEIHLNVVIAAHAA